MIIENPRGKLSHQIREANEIYQISITGEYRDRFMMGRLNLRKCSTSSITIYNTARKVSCPSTLRQLSAHFSPASSLRLSSFASPSIAPWSSLMSVDFDPEDGLGLTAVSASRKPAEMVMEVFPTNHAGTQPRSPVSLRILRDLSVKFIHQNNLYSHSHIAPITGKR